ncbi:MAG: hypothetical protein Kow0022_08750 [Phycisphaerales bacterium]
MRQPIQIVDPNAVETVSMLRSVDWRIVGPCILLAALLIVGFAAIAVRKYAKVSLGERAARALSRRMRLSRQAEKALWTVADQLGMRERAGVLLMSRTALLNAVARLATREGDAKSSAAARVLVEQVVATGRQHTSEAPKAQSPGGVSG